MKEVLLERAPICKALRISRHANGGTHFSVCRGTAYLCKMNKKSIEK